MSRIYLSPPDVGPDERELLLDAFDSNWIAPLGPHVDAFEAELAQFVGVENGVALTSGTAALHLALHLAGIGAGDEVLVPTLTFIASASAVTYVGATPVFVDCSPSTWQMDPGLLEETFSDRARNGRLPKAIVTVDLYGQCSDYSPITALCEEYGVRLIEDAAEALGATYKNSGAGSFGDMAVFSFNGNKIITTSGGGMLVSHSKQLADKARYLSTQARQPVVHYEHLDVGFNYRLSNLLAALGRGQLKNLPSKIARRKQINTTYRELLSEIPGVGFLPIADYGEPNYWLTCITVRPGEFGADREQIRTALEAQDIESRPTWKPLHLQPVFKDIETVGGSVASRIFDIGLCLPSGSNLGDAEQQRVIDTILETHRSG
ncbi:MAG: aminotransferase class I/II-fold pyridoxal phosphate-dependent enzyme [Acidimicrobiales bacterium]